MASPTVYCTLCGFRASLKEGNPPSKCPACCKFSIQVESPTISCRNCSTPMIPTTDVCPSCKINRNVKRRGRDERAIKISDV